MHEDLFLHTHTYTHITEKTKQKHDKLDCLLFPGNTTLHPLRRNILTNFQLRCFK